MKKLVLAFMMGAAAMAANAQVNYKVQTACHPQDVKHMTRNFCAADS